MTLGQVLRPDPCSTAGASSGGADCAWVDCLHPAADCVLLSNRQPACLARPSCQQWPSGDVTFVLKDGFAWVTLPGGQSPDTLPLNKDLDGGFCPPPPIFYKK